MDENLRSASPQDTWASRDSYEPYDAYWSPFLGGQAPAPGYPMSLDDQSCEALRERIRSSLPFALDGSIPLLARAWAIKGKR